MPLVTTDLTVVSALPMKDLGAVFESATRSMYGIGGKLSRLARKYGTTFEFFRPTDGPFATLDDDPPQFAIGAHIPTFSGTNGGLVTLHMYLWDRGSHREVTLVAFHGAISGARKSRRYLDDLVDAIKQRDPSVQEAGATPGA